VPPARSGTRSWDLGRFLNPTRYPTIPVLVLAGALSGLLAAVFHLALDASWRGLAGRALDLPRGPVQIALLLTLPTLMGCLLSFLVPSVAPDAGGGLSLVRTAYAGDPERLSFRTWVGALVFNPLSLGSGVPLGPEGPTVVLTSTVSVGLARLLRLPARFVRGMIPVGTAAGIAAIFNTPITGVVFALEEIMGQASREVLGGSIVAAVAAAVVQKQLLAGRHLLPASPAGWTSAWELIGFGLVGAVSGLAAGGIARLVPLLRNRLRATVPSRVVRGGLGGLTVGFLGLIAPRVLGVGYDSVSMWLRGGGDGSTAGIAFLAKFCGVLVALAVPLLGGVFAPSLFLGAALGAATGHAVKHLFPWAAVDPGAYALVGMGAFFAGFLRTPIASVLIVFELTGDYDLVAPLMLAVVLSSIVARRVSQSTLVEQQLEAAGFAVASSSEDPLRRFRARDVMTASPLSLPGDWAARAGWDRAQETGFSLFPVVDGGGSLVGVVPRDVLRDAAVRTPDALLSLLARSPRVVATPEESLDHLAERLAEAGETRCAVVDSSTPPRVVGFISPRDLLRARARTGEGQGEDGPSWT
jgi:CIC family chloride channel protein